MRQLFEYHPIIGYRFIPGLRARVVHESGGYFIRANGLGFRSDREYRPDKVPGVRRVLLFGDSMTAGDGVPNELRFGDRLEAEIPDLEVYNFGLPASGTDQHYLVCRELAGRIDHDLAVITVFLENIRRLSASYRPHIEESGRITIYAKPHFQLEGEDLVLRDVPVPRLRFEEAVLSLEHSEALRRVKDYSRRFAARPPVPQYDEPEGQPWRLMRAILERWIGQHPRPVVLVALPPYELVEERFPPPAFHERFSELSAATGCRFHSPLADLLEYSRAERRAFRYERDIHPTPSGHAALARSLAPVVAGALAKHTGRAGPE